MNNCWRRLYRLEGKHKYNSLTKRTMILNRRVQDYWFNPPVPSFRKGTKHYTTKRLNILEVEADYYKRKK